MAKRLGLVLLAIVFAAGAYVAWKGPSFLVDTASGVLRKAGLPKIDFTISRITFSDVTLEGIRVGGDALEIPRLSAVFTWQELFDAEVGALSIDGLRLTARITPDGVSFGELDAFFFADRVSQQSPAAGPGLDWPFRQLTLREATIDVREEDDVRLRLTVDGGVSRLPNGGLAIGPARIAAANDDLDVTAGVTATIHPAGILVADMDLQGGTFTHQGVTGRALTGNLSATIPLQELSAAEATGSLEISLDSLPFGLTPFADLTLTYSQGFLLADLVVRDDGSGLSAEFQTTADLSEDPTRQTVALEASLTAENAAGFPKGILPFSFSAGEAGARIAANAPLEQLQRIAQAEDLTGLLQSAPDVEVSVRGSRLESPLFPGRLSLASTLSLTPDADGSLNIALADAVTVRLTPTDAAAWAALLGAARQDGPLSPINVIVSETGPPLLSARLTGEGADVRLTGALSAEGGGLPSIDGKISAKAGLSRETGIASIRLNALDLTAPIASVPGFDLSGLSISAKGGGTVEASEGSLELSAALGSRPGAPLSLTDGRLALPMTWRVANGELRLQGGPCPALGFRTTAYGGTTIQAPEARFCLSPLRVRIEQAENGHKSIALEAGIRHKDGPILVALPGEHRLKIDAGGDIVVVKADGGSDGFTRFDAVLSLTNVLVPTAPVELNSLRVQAARSSVGGAIAVESRAEIRDLARPTRFGPAALRANVTLSGEGLVKARGAATVEPDLLTLEWEADHDRIGGMGRATARLLPFRFSERDSRLVGVVPFLKTLSAVRLRTTAWSPFRRLGQRQRLCKGGSPGPRRTRGFDGKIPAPCRRCLERRPNGNKRRSLP